MRPVIRTLAVTATAVLAACATSDGRPTPSPSVSPSDPPRILVNYYPDCADTDRLDTPCVQLRGPDVWELHDRNVPVVGTLMPACASQYGNPIGQLPCVWDRMTMTPTVSPTWPDPDGRYAVYRLVTDVTGGR